MKRIRNKHRLGLGIIMTALAGCCMVIAVLKPESARFVVGAALFLLFAGVNYYYAFRKKDLVQEIAGSVDERDSLIAMKCCQRMVQIVNYVLLGVTLVSLVLYGAFRMAEFLVVAVTLCGVLVLMLVVMLVMNGRLERRL